MARANSLSPTKGNGPFSRDVKSDYYMVQRCDVLPIAGHNGCRESIARLCKLRSASRSRGVEDALELRG